MSELTNTAFNQQVYKIHTGDSLLSQVEKVILVLFPRGISVAGFSERGDLLTIRYNDYKSDLPTWILDFFEHQFLNDSMLSTPHKVVATFVATEKSLLIPDTLYKKEEAENWLRQLYFIESNEIISPYSVREDNAYYMYAWPSAIQSLIGRYFTRAKILPFASYQFYKPFKAECSMQCSIGSDEVYATLYKNRTLHWHQVFPYNNVEDIAFRLKHACKENGIDYGELSLQCTATNRNLSDLITGLSQYFPDLKDGSSNVVSNDRSWTSTIYLLQQLYACAL
ncbi:MAG: DUF3822 family protein [Flavipsychrobacter sp.]